MRIVILKDYETVSNWVANYLHPKISLSMQDEKHPFVLGLPTGSTPIGTYKNLVRYYSTGELSFRNIVTFNMDEYVGIPENHPESYHYFMHHHLFDHIDIPKENINILNGNAGNLEKECQDYEDKIATNGGIDLFLGGIGPDGHIAFNEPGSSLTSKTRIKTLSYDTILANSRFFDDDLSKVPKMALTVGVGTVKDAREVVIIATGYNKARAIRQIVEGGVSHMWTASMLQLHRRMILVCDDAATWSYR